MEETKEIQSAYKFFRTFIYVSILIEFFVFAMPYQALATGGSLMMRSTYSSMRRKWSFFPWFWEWHYWGCPSGYTE